MPGVSAAQVRLAETRLRYETKGVHSTQSDPGHTLGLVKKAGVRWVSEDLRNENDHGPE